MNTDFSISAASAVQQAKISNEAAMKIASKTQEAQQQQGNSAVEMVKQVEKLASQIAAGRLDVHV
jgi:F0F1-type ATP synthase epsilon subunit